MPWAFLVFYDRLARNGLFARNKLVLRDAVTHHLFALLEHFICDPTGMQEFMVLIEYGHKMAAIGVIGRHPNPFDAFQSQAAVFYRQQEAGEVVQVIDNRFIITHDFASHLHPPANGPYSMSRTLP